MPFSDFNYIRPAELPSLIHTMASVTDEALAAKFISDAERIVDSYVGAFPRFYQPRTGETSSALASGVTALASTLFGERRPNYWAKGGVYVELIDGVASGLLGARRLVVASDDNAVTLASGFDGVVSGGAQFRLEQVSAFPRLVDTNPLGDPILRESLRFGVAAQVEYGIQYGSEAYGLGDERIASDEGGDVTSRTYGSGYSEVRDARRRVGLAVFLAPKARVFLQRLINSTGRLRE